MTCETNKRLTRTTWPSRRSPGHRCLPEDDVGTRPLRGTKTRLPRPQSASPSPPRRVKHVPRLQGHQKKLSKPLGLNEDTDFFKSSGPSSFGPSESHEAPNLYGNLWNVPDANRLQVHQRPCRPESRPRTARGTHSRRGRGRPRRETRRGGGEDEGGPPRRPDHPGSLRLLKGGGGGGKKREPIEIQISQHLYTTRFCLPFGGPSPSDRSRPSKYRKLHVGPPTYFRPCILCKFTQKVTEIFRFWTIPSKENKDQ